MMLVAFVVEVLLRWKLAFKLNSNCQPLFSHLQSFAELREINASMIEQIRTRRHVIEDFSRYELVESNDVFTFHVIVSTVDQLQLLRCGKVFLIYDVMRL